MNNTNQPIRFDKAGEILDAVIGTEGTAEEIVPMNLPENNETNPQTSPEAIPEEAAFAPETREAETPCEADPASGGETDAGREDADGSGHPKGPGARARNARSAAAGAFGRDGAACGAARGKDKMSIKKRTLKRPFFALE